jgi:hypothetical protein
MGTERPTVGQWRVWYARFSAPINQHATRKDNAGTFARRLEQAGQALWVFLDVQGVEATNNTAERAHASACYGASRVKGHAARRGIAGWSRSSPCVTPVVSEGVRRFRYLIPFNGQGMPYKPLPAVYKPF